MKKFRFRRNAKNCLISRKEQCSRCIHKGDYIASSADIKLDKRQHNDSRLSGLGSPK